MVLIVFLLKNFFNGLFPLKCLSIVLRMYLPTLILDNLQKKVRWGWTTFHFFSFVYFFFIPTAAIIVIPITSFIQTNYMSHHYFEECIFRHFFGRSPDGDTEYFDIVAGVLQRDTLAPYLFIICLDYVLRTSIDKIRENGFELT